MIRVLLVDDQSLIRQGLKALLELEPDLQVVEKQKWASGDRVGRNVATRSGTDGYSDAGDGRGSGDARNLSPIYQYENLGANHVDDDEYVTQALRYGATGYLLKDTPSEELAAAIRAVHKGTLNWVQGCLKRRSPKCRFHQPVHPRIGMS
jgi:DNA-binding NarL/FixJ family response regulator